MISSDEESADEGKWLPELFLRADDKKLIETGDWLTDRHITAAQMLLKKDFPHVDGLQVTLLAETGGWNILVNEGVQILNDSNIGFVFLQSDAPRTPLTSMTVGTLMYPKTSSSKSRVSSIAGHHTSLSGSSAASCSRAIVTVPSLL